MKSLLVRLLISVLLIQAAVCGPFDSIGKGLHKLGEFGQKVGQEAKKVGENAVDTTKSIGQKIGDTAKNIGGGAIDGTKSVAEKIGEGTKKAIDSVGQFGKDAWDSTKKAENKVEDVASKAAHGTADQFKKGLDALKDFKKLMSIFGFSRKPEPGQTNPTTPGSPGPSQEPSVPTPGPTPLPMPEPMPTPTPTTPSETPSVIPIPNWRPPIPHGQDSQSTNPTPSLTPRPSWKPSHPGQGIFSSSSSTATAKPAVNPFGGRIDGQRGQFYVGSGLEEIIAKLADEKVRSQIIDGFFGATPKVKLSQKCTDAISEVKSLLPLIPQYIAARQVSADSGRSDAADLIGSLSLFIKADAIISKMAKDSEIQECLGSTMKPFKVVVAKLVLANEEFVEKVKENTNLWFTFASVALNFQLEMYNSAGQGLADMIKAVAKTKVTSLPDDKAEKIDLWKCFTAMLKMKSKQKTVSEDPEGQMDSWITAAIESKQACLATADLN